MTDIAVIIVNWNAGDLLRRCLEGVARQTVAPGRVIVADNGSSDGSLETVEDGIAGVEVLRLGENLGFAAANNRALATIEDCRWVALLNPDAVPDPDWLMALRRAAAANDEFSFFASLLVMDRDRARIDGAGDSYHVSGLAWRRYHGGSLAQSDLAQREVFSPCAAAALYRTAALREVGGFEERFFCYFEDVDLSFRLRLRGHRCLFVPESLVYHVGSATTGADSDFSVYHGHRNLVWTFFRNMPAGLLWLYLPLHLLMNLVTVLWYVLHGRAGVILLSKRDALLGLRQALRERRHIQKNSVIKASALRAIMVHGISLILRGRHGS